LKYILNTYIYCFPDLRLIHGWRDHFVGKASAMGQTN